MATRLWATLVVATLGRRQHSVDGRDVLAGEYSEGPPMRRLRRARETTCMAREEERRLQEATSPDTPWKKWGPYLSERQWGTVREDYSETGDAWNYFSHDQARSRAYRWGEDGLAGISGDHHPL